MAASCSGGFDIAVYKEIHYVLQNRKNLVFSWENLENAKTAYGKLVARVAALKSAETDSVDEAAFAQGKQKFIEALDNDLNTALAVTALYDVFKLKTNDKTKLALIEDFERVLDLGLIAAAKKQSETDSASGEEESDVSPELLTYINERIEARKNAKKAKNFAEADAIRDELASRGITILDTREGTKFTVN